ncbi:PAN-1 domain and Apple-like domain-containing protein [Aphelenchoides fujianensis]|nr:PAN-1 domain and Apple-like domain-containing protein [Aphelenchoides fujianensis]
MLGHYFFVGFFLVVHLRVAESRSQYVRCFQLHSRKSIDNYQPIMELFYVSPHQCIDQCIQATNNGIKVGLCKSFVYNHLQHSCRLYDHQGTQIPAIIHPAIGYDFYRRTATTQECAGPLQRFWAKHKPETGDLAARAAQPIRSIDSPIELEKEKGGQPVVDVDIETGGAPGVQPEDLETTTTLSSSTPQHAPSNRAAGRNHPGASKQNAPRANPYKAPSFGLQFDDQGGRLRIPHGLQPASIYTRPCETSVGYYVVGETEMRIPDGQSIQTAVVENVEHRECAGYCTENTTPDQIRFKCTSFNYNSATKICSLHTILAAPHGVGTLVGHSNITYTEKFCLPRRKQSYQSMSKNWSLVSNTKCGQNSLFQLRADQRLKAAIIKNFGDRSNVASCLQECLNVAECKFASFHSNQRVCFLHSAQQAVGNAEREVGWILVENGCERPLAHDSQSSEWSQWSDCRYKAGSQQLIEFGRETAARARVRTAAPCKFSGAE